jgi:hypothetical protein
VDGQSDNNAAFISRSVFVKFMILKVSHLFQRLKLFILFSYSLSLSFSLELHRILNLEDLRNLRDKRNYLEPPPTNGED